MTKEERRRYEEAITKVTPPSEAWRPDPPPHYYASPRRTPKPGDLCARCGRGVDDAIHLVPR